MFRKLAVGAAVVGASLALATPAALVTSVAWVNPPSGQPLIVDGRCPVLKTVDQSCWEGHAHTDALPGTNPLS